MSTVMNMAPFVDMTPLKRILANQHIDRGRGYLAWVVYSVSADCEHCPVLIFFLWSHAADELSVCHVFIATFWNVFPYDECDCVGWVFKSVLQLHLLGVRIRL